MDVVEVTLRAFKDELVKIGGGFARSGVRPYKASTLASIPGKFVKKQFMTKMSALGPRHMFAASAAGAAGALYGRKKVKQMAEDYQPGKQIRQQQMGG